MQILTDHSRAPGNTRDASGAASVEASPNRGSDNTVATASLVPRGFAAAKANVTSGTPHASASDPSVVSQVHPALAGAVAFAPSDSAGAAAPNANVITPDVTPASVAAESVDNLSSDLPATAADSWQPFVGWASTNSSDNPDGVLASAETTKKVRSGVNNLSVAASAGIPANRVTSASPDNSAHSDATDAASGAFHEAVSVSVDLNVTRSPVAKFSVSIALAAAFQVALSSLSDAATTNGTNPDDSHLQLTTVSPVAATVLVKSRAASAELRVNSATSQATTSSEDEIVSDNGLSASSLVARPANNSWSAANNSANQPASFGHTTTSANQLPDVGGAHNPPVANTSMSAKRSSTT